MKVPLPILVAVIGVLAYLAYQYIVGGPHNLIWVRASDGEQYHVQNLPHSDDAAELMATIQKNLSAIKTFYSQEEYQSDTPARLLVERFHPSALMENDVTSSDTSYSENKGDKIVLCLRDKTSAPEFPLVDANTVMFVVLHEMSHLMTTDLNAAKHTPEFWANFRRLLQDASKLGVYTPVNYARTPIPYCGMTITDSPL
jgi:hypothetical protein